MPPTGLAQYHDIGADQNAQQPPAGAPPSGSTPQQTLAAAQNPNTTGPNAPQTTTAPSPMIGGQAPLVLRPAKTGLAGIVQKIGDVLAGKTTPDTYEDDAGNKYVYNRQMSPGEQWKKIAGEGIVGAAAGFAAGKGAGNQAKAPLAGAEAGMKLQDQDNQRGADLRNQTRQDVLDKANAQMLRMNLAEHAWTLQRSQQKAGQEDLDFYQKQLDRLTGPGPEGGGTYIGHAAHEWDIGGLLKVNPDLMKDLVVNHAIELLPHVNADGTHEGVDVIKMPDGWRKSILPAGTVFRTFDPVAGKMVEHHSSDPLTAGEQADYDTAAYNDQLKYQNDKAKQQADATETGLKKAQTKTQGAEQTKDVAEANEANARAQSLRRGSLNADGTPNAQFEMLAQALYDGDVMPTDLKREAKDAGFDPNALMARAVEIGKQSGRPWSESIIKQEQDFAKNEKTQAALDGIDRILNPQSGYMQQMLDTAKKADLGTNGAFNSTSLAVQRFFGGSSAKNFNTSVTELRRSIAGLIGNPLLGGSETDKKIEQADDLIGEHPTLENLQSAAQILDNALGAQRQSIVGNNRFLSKRYGNSPTRPGVAPPPSAQTVRMRAPNGDVSDVPADQVQHYTALGAQKVNQ